jgi:copper(I)-binding protein
MLRAIAVISAAAYPTTTLPAAFAFGIASQAADASMTINIVAKQSYKLGQLVIEAPWARATPKGAHVGGGYLKITNTGKEAYRLIACAGA